MLNIRTHQQGDSIILTLEGKVTFDVIAYLKAALERSVSLEPKRVIVNLDKVTRMDVSGVELIAETGKIMTRKSSQLILCHIGPIVMGTLGQTNSKDFLIVATEKDALKIPEKIPQLVS